jgi:hypothetical protein
MMTLELLTDFIQEDLRYNREIICESFSIHNKILEIKVRNLSDTVTGFGEVVELERYQNWLNKKRVKKINQIL